VAGESSSDNQNTHFQNLAPILFSAFNVAAIPPSNFYNHFLFSGTLSTTFILRLLTTLKGMESNFEVGKMSLPTF